MPAPVPYSRSEAGGRDHRPMPAALEALASQPRVQEYFARALAEERVSHAYLFVGPKEAIEPAATAIAQCLVCSHGGCGGCDDCQRVAHGTHPDVRVLTPGSAQGYLVGQVRDLIADVPLSPVRARTKVYLVHDAGRLWGTSANALLKTLEEPPAGVVFILTAPSVDSVLDTIASRCQQIPFVSAGGEASASSGAGGVAGSAAAIPLDERSEAARLAIECTLALPALDSWSVIGYAKRIVAAVKAPLDELKDEQAARDEGIDEFLTAKALKELADARRRELTQHERSGMMEVPVAVESVLRDLLLIRLGQESDIANTGLRTELMQLSRSLEPEQAVRAIEACTRSQDRLSSGVTPQLALEAMFLQVKEALTCHS